MSNAVGCSKTQNSAATELTARGGRFTDSPRSPVGWLPVREPFLYKPSGQSERKAAEAREQIKFCAERSPCTGPSVLGWQTQDNQGGECPLPSFARTLKGRDFRYDVGESQPVWLAREEWASFLKDEHPQALRPQLYPPASGIQGLSDRHD